MDAYRVMHLVGEGSYGRVFKGRRRFSGQVVAMKFMPKQGRSENELRSLKREIEIMRGLQHPNIVPLYDSFETKTEVVVVTEYAEGQLFQILEEDGNLSESLVREIACQLVSALHYLHAHRIIHRDMKPQNILIGSSGEVKLCDFGFARAMSVSTLVVTSIKGTPLYMSPELVQEEPYDHTADLWSLGCILYELHTGTPPFYTNSLFHLVQLIIKDEVKWPDTMSDSCRSLLKGLLTKDPQKRLSWPDLLHHPFVIDGVLVTPDTNVLSPLVATPSPDMLALKLQQVKEKTVPRSGESRLLRKARGRRENAKGERPSGSGGVTVEKDDTRTGSVHSATAAVTTRAEPTSCDVMVVAADDENLHPNNQSHSKSKERSQISKDYEQEFPAHRQVGSRSLRRRSEDSPVPPHKKDDDSEDVCERVVPTPTSSQQNKRLNYSATIPELKSEILALQFQLIDGDQNEAWWMQQPLKDLLDLILTSDLEKSHLIGQELGLPHILFELIHVAVENSNFIQQPWILPTLREILVVLIIYWGKHSDWVKEEQRLEEFSRPLVSILNQPSLASLAPLAASVLSLMTPHSVDVEIDMDNLTALLKNLLLDSYEPQLSPVPGWGLGDGLLSLLLHNLYEVRHEPQCDKQSDWMDLHNLYEREKGCGASCLDPVMFLDLWKRIGALLATTKPDTDFCSAKGLHSFLSTSLCVFSEDPYSCIPLFSEPSSRCVYTLCRLMATDCLHLFATGSPGRPEVDVSHDSVSVLSCQLLCFPFALDLPSYAMPTILQMYDSCGIVASLLQVIETLPAPLLQLPLSLLSRLLLCDPGRFYSRLRKAASGFFAPPRNNRLTSTEHRTPQTRTASSLLSALLQRDGLWDSAEELLILLSQVARCYSQYSHHQPHLETPVLRQALSHPHYQIRVATLRLLGNLNPLRLPTQPALPPDIFQNLIDCLQDPSKPLRRMACRAVRNWLGYLAAEAGCETRKSNGKGCETTWRYYEKELYKQQCSHSDTSSDLATRVEQGEDDEEDSGWLVKARLTVPKLAPLITDSDALTRRYGCAALGNLVHVDGAVSLLLEEGAFGSLLRAACTDSHFEVRQAAIATLCLYSGEDSTRQVLISLNARKKLLKASRQAPPRCDYDRLIGLLSPDHQEQQRV